MLFLSTAFLGEAQTAAPTRQASLSSTIYRFVTAYLTD